MSQCSRSLEQGSLLISAPRSGTFEIYRSSSDDQFVSEMVARFNETTHLLPGRYLVVADCSSQEVVVLPNQRVDVIVHTITFTPPSAPTASDSFRIQCNQARSMGTKQQIRNRYFLNVVGEQHQILVGTAPMTLDLRGDQTKPQKQDYPLAAVQVSDYPNSEPLSYFISAKSARNSLTISQELGRWEFLLPGSYQLQLNGTRQWVSLRPGEKKAAIPAFLRIETPEGTDLSSAKRVRGNPQLVEVNDGHWLNFNHTYPVLPGEAVAKISGSSRQRPIVLVEGETNVLKTRSVRLDLGCSPWEWSCLGSKEIALYLGDELYPFVESTSDVPVIFFADAEQSEGSDVKTTETAADIAVGISGSRDIRYKLPRKQAHVDLKIGYLEIMPQPGHNPAMTSDLIRVESIQEPQLGHTLDVSMTAKTVMPLIAGTYNLAHYVSMTKFEGERKLFKRFLTITPAKITTARIQVNFSKKKLARYREDLKSKSRASRRAFKRYPYTAPLEVF